MSDQRYLWNVLRIVSARCDKQVRRLEELYETPLSDTGAPEEIIVLMITRLIQMMDLLSACHGSGDDSMIEACQSHVEDIHKYDRRATAGMVEQASLMGKQVFKIVMRFPSRMERISVMLDNILDCCRIKAKDGVSFSGQAQEELSEIFRLVSNILEKLRDAIILPNRSLIGQIKNDCRGLELRLEEARGNNWERLEAGICSAHGAPLYVEILDSFRNVNEYVARMSRSLLELERLQSTV